MGTTGQSITLANSIIGVGILAMPFCFQKCGVLLATLILLSMGLVSRLCSHLLLKSALLARRRNFEFLAFHVFGSAGKVMVELGIIGFLMGTCIAYFVVVGDLGPQIISKMFNINQSDILRTSIMVIVSLVCVLPLGLLRNVDSLSNVSAATIGFYFCLVIKVISEAASQLFVVELGSRLELWKPEGVLQCVPIFSMALFCQTQLFEIFESMPTLSLEKMNVVTKNAINICTGVYFTLGLFGFIAFSKHDISGNILMSLSPTMANDVIKLGFVMSLAFSFPLIIFPCRASLYSFLYRKVHPSQHDHIINHSIPESTFRCITVGIIAVALCVSLLIPNIELVLGLVGSTIGVLICMVFPAACFINVTFKNTNERILAKKRITGITWKACRPTGVCISLLILYMELVLGLMGSIIGVRKYVVSPAACFISVTFKNTNERVLAKVVLVLGLGIMVLGTYANLQAAENAPDKYDERHITQERIDQIVEDFFQSRKLEDRGIVAKPPQKVEEAPKQEVKHIKEVIADSEVQPPNPVPPESQPEENKESPRMDPVPVLAEKKKKLKEAPKEVKQEVDKVSETHPKNLNKITDSKQSDDEIKKEQKSDAIKEEIKQMSNQQKIDLLKQAQLAETIKQHGEEQKELIKEQKEILDSILKTKQEIQQDKNEAKKIAVESIQKIANVAIQSLSAVSEQPAGPADIKMEPGETANEAVKKIADVAVEAIKEIKDKPIEVAPLIHEKVLKVSQANPVPVQSNGQEMKQNKPVASVQNGVPSSDKSQDVHMSNGKLKIDLINNNNQPNNAVLENNKDINKPEDPRIVQPVVQKTAAVNNNVDNIELKKPLQINTVPEVVRNSADLNHNLEANKPVVNMPLNNVVHNGLAGQKSNNIHGSQNVPQDQKTHSHSQDEPQSYKQGEDLQKPDKSNILNNVPLPLAMNGANLKSSEIKEVVDKPKNVLNGAKQTINEIINNELPVPERQKREVVDCTNKATLRAEDKEICKALVNSREDNSPEILPNVDLNDMLPKQLPLVHLNMAHQIRSLKSYNEEERR